jgi:hypothetical protein
MNIGSFFSRVGKGAQWPFAKVSQEVGEEIAEQAALTMRAALAEAPVLDALLDGKPVTIKLTVQFQID